MNFFPSFFMPFNVSEEMADTNRLVDIKNNECILVEFVNEENSIQDFYLGFKRVMLKICYKYNKQPGTSFDTVAGY